MFFFYEKHDLYDFFIYKNKRYFMKYLFFKFILYLYSKINNSI